MGDAIKIAVKTGLIAVIMVALWAVFANVQVPAVSFTEFTSAISMALAVSYHYVPALQILFPVALGLVGVELGILTFKYAMIAVKWVMKVNE